MSKDELNAVEMNQPSMRLDRTSEIQPELIQQRSPAVLPEDAVRLTIGQVTDPLLKWDFFKVMSARPVRRRTPFVGFSFFGEIGGFQPVGTEPDYVHLKDTKDTISPISSPPHKIVKTFSEWHADLGIRRINFSRVFAFATPPTQTAYYPYSSVGAQTASYDLRTVTQRYVDRLDEYIAIAKQHETVVCLTLFSDQALRVGNGFEANPFNINKNKKPDYNFITPSSTVAVRRTFYDIAAPPDGWQNLQTPGVWSNWSIQQRLYAVERYVVTELVNRTKKHWNVMYEISNEPVAIAGSELDEKWNFEVASWIDGLLWDPGAVRRKRLVLCDLGAPDRIATLKKLLAGAAHHLIDAFAFHGEDWAGASSIESNIQSTIRQAVNTLYNTAITGTRTLATYPVALIFDSDASDLAERNPYAFCHATLGLNGSYNHRWSSKNFLALKDQLDALNRVSGPASFLVEHDGTELNFSWNDVPNVSGYRLTFQPSSPGGFAPPPVTVGPATTSYSMQFTTPFGVARTTIVALFGAVQTYPTVVIQALNPMEPGALSVD